ncbi:GlsB/YeaQ/YmgE family stress response membrane protein [Saccharomonospora sp. NPDC006951]
MAVSGIISAILVGLVLGVLARLIAPGKQNIPVWLTILVGIVAAFIGTAIARGLGYADTSGWDWLEFFTQLVVAAIGVSIAASLHPRNRSQLKK